MLCDVSNDIFFFRMGAYANYSLELKIKACNIIEALRLLNELHSDEMLLKHAQDRIYGGNEETLKKPVKERRWYSWVSNPEYPYLTLDEAFDNWNIVEENIISKYDENGDFIISGTYDNKIGQQKFFLEYMASVIEDLSISVKFEGHNKIVTWTIKNHVFKEIK